MPPHSPVSALRAVAHPVRLGVLQALSQRGEMAVGDLLLQAVGGGYSQSALSQHLSVLRREGLVETRKESQRVYYSLCQATLGELQALLGALRR